MATLYVRNVPADLYAELQHAASDSGRSLNAEVIDILGRAVAGRRRRSDWYEEFVALRKELRLPKEAVDEAVAAIRQHRDAGL